MSSKKKIKGAPAHEELLPSICYLHGDVAGDEFKAACAYEYARESIVLQEMARLSERQTHFYEQNRNIVRAVENKFPGVHWNSVIWQCPSFPQKSWNQLTPHERQNILKRRPTGSSSQIEPLRVDRVWYLAALGVLGQLNRMAEKVMESPQPERRLLEVYPFIEGRPIRNISDPKKKPTQLFHVMFTLDFRKTRSQLRREFDKWLQLPANEARFDAYRRNPTGTTGRAKDRLKDLASWRLYRALGFNEALAFAENHRKQDKTGKPRKFHDARKEQSKTGMPLNESPLYSEESGWLKAKARAQKHLAIVMPWEFGKLAEDVEISRNELAQLFSKIL